tara:strand:- start:131 stop:328 length:198 start_codon:yes stop_codon:yes gene_type:complete
MSETTRVVKMSEEEMDWYSILYGMIQDGMSKYEAMAAMAVMDCPDSTIRVLQNNILGEWKCEELK